MKHCYFRCFFLLPALFGWSIATVWAQCPAVAACTPNGASNPNAAAFGMGIFNVTLGSINHTTGGNTQGYQNYGCTQQTPLARSKSTSRPV